ncbi:MAG: nitroreductase family protein [Defluviitaleaceae bacterium]|nr:nitroreductase family protein [Defluviitaleaceae bacterium]
MTASDAIKNRTSYRGKYENKKVPREDLIKIAEAGLAAPSGCNKPTTSLIVVGDADLLRKLRDVIKPPAAETAPAIICVLTQKIIAYRDRCFNVQDYSAAIQNMLLAAVELGYQSCWYEGHITDADMIGRKMAKILGVPEDYELVCFLPIGTASQSSAYADKKPFEKRVWFNGFGNQICS